MMYHEFVCFLGASVLTEEDEVADVFVEGENDPHGCFFCFFV